MRYLARYLGPILLLLLATASCDCESRVRSMIGDRGARAEQDKAEQRRAPSESSAPREQEPNDFPAQATLLELGGDLRPVKGSLSSPTDHDWYALTSRNGESWQVELTVTPTTPTLDLMILVEVAGAPGTPTEYNLSGPGGAETIPILAVTETPQRILIQSGPQATSGEYEISFKKRLSGGAIEAEPNDEVDAATVFEAPGMIEGFYDRPGDRDLYYVAPSRLGGALVNLEVSPIAGIVQTLNLYVSRDLKTPYLSLQIPPDRAAGIPNLRVPPDALGLWIELSAGEKFNREKSYQLRLIGHAPVNKKLEEEPNDTRELAQKIEVGAALSGYFHRPDDVDYFRIYVDGVPSDSGQPPAAPDSGADAEGADRGAPEDAPDAEGPQDEAPEVRDPLAAVADKTPTEHLLRVIATAKGEEARVGIALQGSDDMTVSQPGAEAILCSQPVAAGGYLEFSLRPVEYPNAGLQQDFDYELLTEDLAQLGGLEVEPNDTSAQADKLVAGEKRIGFISAAQDVDVFAFAVPFAPAQPVDDAADEAADPDKAESAGGVHTTTAPTTAPTSQTRKVTIRLSPNPANLGFEVRDDEGGRVAQVNRAGAGGEERLTMDLPSGLYFIHVSGTYSPLCKPYELTFDLLR